MENLVLFLSLLYIFSFVLGRFFKKINIPPIFAPLLLGILLAIKDPFFDITSSQSFNFLATLGMYFMLFLIGFEIDLKRLKKTSFFIIKSTILIVLIEALIDSLVFHTIFGYKLVIAFILGLVFATVGEEILLPILEEFKITKTKLGQSILEIGVLDNTLEFISIILISLYLGVSSRIDINLRSFIVYFLLFLILVYLLWQEKEKISKFLEKLDIQTLFIFFFALFFLFVFIGENIQASALILIIGGIIFRHFIRLKEEFERTEEEIKTFAYSLFGPLFFLWVGKSVDVKYLFKYPFYIFLIVVCVILSNLIASFFVTKKELGVRNAFLLGISFCVKFSTSIILIKVLYDIGILKNELYSILVGSSIFFVIIPPLLFSLIIKIPQKIRNGLSKK